MIAKLNARTVESLKPTIGKRMDYHDTEVRGLTLRVTERGVKSWTVLYRHRGRLRRLTLGDATITLADARERARDAIRMRVEGRRTRPPRSRRAARPRRLATSPTDTSSGTRNGTSDRGKRTTGSSGPRSCRRGGSGRSRTSPGGTCGMLVEAIADRGAPIMANRTTALISKLFKFALDDELIDASPAVRIARPAPEQKRDRVLRTTSSGRCGQSFDALVAAMARVLQAAAHDGAAGRGSGGDALAGRRPGGRLVDDSGGARARTGWRTACRSRLGPGPSEGATATRGGRCRLRAGGRVAAAGSRAEAAATFAFRTSGP